MVPYRPGEVRAHTVHLVDEADPWHVVPVGLAPHRFRLGLHARHSVKNDDTTVQHAEAPLHFGGEVNVPGGVYHVDLVLFPVAGGCRRGYGDAPRPLLFHPVHNRRALIYPAHLVGLSGEKQHLLGDRGLAGIDVGYEAHIAYTF